MKKRKHSVREKQEKKKTRSFLCPLRERIEVKRGRSSNSGSFISVFWWVGVNAIKESHYSEEVSDLFHEAEAQCARPILVYSIVNNFLHMSTL